MRALLTDSRVTDDCFLDDEGDYHQQILKFIEVPSFVAVIATIRVTQYT